MKKYVFLFLLVGSFSAYGQEESFIAKKEMKDSSIEPQYDCADLLAGFYNEQASLENSTLGKHLAILEKRLKGEREYYYLSKKVDKKELWRRSDRASPAFAEVSYYIPITVYVDRGSRPTLALQFVTGKCVWNVDDLVVSLDAFVEEIKPDFK